jgi:hypothetical protein
MKLTEEQKADRIQANADAKKAELMRVKAIREAREAALAMALELVRAVKSKNDAHAAELLADVAHAVERWSEVAK